MSQTFVLNKSDVNRGHVMANIQRFIAGLSNDKPWKIVISVHRKTRSSEQNAALWGVAYPALERATGQPVNDWHEYMLGEYFGWVEYRLFGKKKLRPARTTTTGYRGEENTLTTSEFVDYYDFIQSRAAQNGIYVPDPDPFWREQAA